MATLDEENDPNKKNAATSGGAYIGGGSGQGATTGIKSESPTASGSYTNLQNYLGANQGNDAAMGQAAYGVVNQAGQAAEKSLGDYQTNATNAITAGTQNVNQDTLGGFGKGMGVDQNVLKDINAGKYSTGAPTVNYQIKAIDTSYNGPTDYNAVQGQQQAVGDVQKTGELAGLAGSNAGVGQLLRTAYDRPSYSTGENQLDTFLTQGGAGGQQALGKIGSDWGHEGDKLTNAYSGIQSQIGKAQETSKATGATYDKAQADAKAQADKTNQTYGTYFKDWKKGQDDAAESARLAANAAKANATTKPSSLTAAAAPAKPVYTQPGTLLIGPNQTPTGKVPTAAQTAAIPKVNNSTLSTEMNPWGASNAIDMSGFAAFGGKIPEKKYKGILSSLGGGK